MGKLRVVLKEDKYKTYMEDLDAFCVLNGLESRADAFVQEKCQFLVEQDVLQSFNILPYEDDDYNCRIDAWGLKSALDGSKDDSLVLIISKFYDQEDIGEITLSDFRAYCNKAKRFFQNSLKDEFRLNRLQAGSNISRFADYIYKRKDNDQQVTIIGITNGRISARNNKLVITENTTSTVTFRYDVWDFARFSLIESSKSGRESVDIDFVNDYGVLDGLSALHIDTGSQDIDSYLFVLPGRVLYEMYEQWNERLLEQNPRTFLQFTGKINKGIRGTLIQNPEYFFSYNNGIAAVASGIELNTDKGSISKIINFQIVNGGQTTASIYNAYYKSLKDKKELAIDKVYVMVKLSVIKEQEKADRIIPKISEYSNSQNKVASSAFSIRHPYHLKMEEFSRCTYAPSDGGKQNTLWFYERAQGQYKNAVNLCHTKTEKTAFENVNPKEQMFKSVDLAKYVMTFEMRPDVVCLGSQKCYAFFSKEHLKEDDDGQGIIGPEINQEYFKELCCKALLFKALEKRVSRGLRFVLVPYTLAILMRNLVDNGLNFNYALLWKKQWDNEGLFSLISDFSDTVYDAITRTMPDNVAIISEWGKKNDCWRSVKDTKFDINQLFDFTVSKADYISNVMQAKSNAKMNQGIDDQSYVVNKGSAYWDRLYQWAKKGNMNISSTELSILSWAINMSKRIPSDKQSKVIIKLENRAISFGFN